MTDKTAADQAKAADQPKHTDAQLETARTEARSEGEKKGRSEGVNAERERIRGILAHADAKDRPQLALSLALESDMSVEQAAKLLAKAPKEPSTGSAFAALMAGVKNPKVGVDVEEHDKPRIESAAELYARRKQQHQARTN